MNLRRGLFRAWILASACWIAGVAHYANLDVDSKMAASGYIYQEVIDPNCKTKYDLEHYPTFKQLYPACTSSEEGTYIMPSTYDKPPVFISHERKGAGWTFYDFPDGSVLLLDQIEGHPTQTGAEAEYLKAAFWDQRWARYWRTLQPWLPIMFWPIIGLAVLMLGMIWVIGGFSLV